MLPDQLVLVIDGPVGADQEDVIADFIARGTIPTTLVRLAAQSRSGRSPEFWATRCLGEFILRMDSDDICTVDRIERQIAYAEAHPDIDVVASWSEEFFDDGAPCRIKVTPTVHEGIVRALRWRNVVHHPTLLIRKEAAHGHFRLSQRLRLPRGLRPLCTTGSVGRKVPCDSENSRQDPLQHGATQPSGRLQILVNDVRFRVECFRAGFLTFRQFIAVTLMYSIFRLLSGTMRRRLYGLARI